jgi:hypothetical protein
MYSSTFKYLASHQHFVKKEEKKRRSILGKKRIFNRIRGKKEAYRFRPKKT